MSISTISGIIFYICVFIILPGYIAHKKGRRFWLWSLLGIIMPYLSLLLIILIDPAPEKKAPELDPGLVHPGPDDLIRTPGGIMDFGEGDSPYMPPGSDEPVFRDVLEEELASCAELYAAGLLTQEEYEARKARILAGGH